MKINKAIILILSCIAIVSNSMAQNIDMTGYVRNYTGVLTNNGHMSTLQNTLDINLERRGNKTLLKASPVIYTYVTDSLNFQVRELYLDLYFKKIDLRIGKQQVVWGKADGAFITDIVSPLNLSEFLLPDFNEIRQGVLATKFNYYLQNDIIEIIWLPQFTPIQRPNTNSIWYKQHDLIAPTTFDYTQSEIKPSIENSEIFAKYSALTSKIDFEIMAGYTWNDEPSMHIRKQIDTTTSTPTLTGLQLTPQHNRLSLAGGSFSTEIKGVILRGESAFYHGKYFQTTDPHQPDALIKKDYIHYLVGIDFNIKSINISSQFIQEAIIDHNNYIEQNKFNNTLTLLARYDTRNETLHFELFTYIGLNNPNALIRPKATYDFADGFSIMAGANIFTGNKQEKFGQYTDNSMVYTKVKYNF